MLLSPCLFHITHLKTDTSQYHFLHKNLPGHQPSPPTSDDLGTLPRGSIISGSVSVTVITTLFCDYPSMSKAFPMENDFLKEKGTGILAISASLVPDAY